MHWIYVLLLWIVVGAVWLGILWIVAGIDELRKNGMHKDYLEPEEEDFLEPEEVNPETGRYH